MLNTLSYVAVINGAVPAEIYILAPICTALPLYARWYVCDVNLVSYLCIVIALLLCYRCCQLFPCVLLWSAYCASARVNILH